MVSFFPLLLALPGGVVAGLPAALLRPPGCEAALDSFGPHLRTEAEFRHAAFAPPRRLVVTLPAAASLATDVALAAMAEAGATVALVASDAAVLLRLSHRVLVQDAGGAWRWEAPEALAAQTVLWLRLAAVGCERRLRIPLGQEGAEPVLAACRARGWKVRESRIEYPWVASR